MTGNIVIIGSDLHSPYQSMEAKIADILVRGIPEMNFIRVSICVGKSSTEKPGFLFVDGFRQWPLATRKSFYALKLAYLILRLRVQGFNSFHFIWNGPVWLMRCYTWMIHLLHGKTIITVLNRFLDPAACAGSDATITHSAGMADILKHHHRVSKQPVYTIPPPVPRSFFISNIDHNSIHKRFLYLSAPKSRAQLRSRGVYLLLDTFKLLAADPDSPDLKVFGRWPEGDADISRMFIEQGISRVDWSSRYVENIQQEIINSLGIVIPYIGDTAGDVPLSGLEAAVSGRIIIATPGLGLSEFLSGYPGYFEVDPEPEKFAEALNRASTTGLENISTGAEIQVLTEKEYAERYAPIYRNTGDE